MKKLLAILLVLSIVFAFGACAGKSGTETPTDAPKPANTATGKVYYLNYKLETNDAWQALAKKYTKQTGVEVKVQTAASETYPQTLKSELAKSNAPTLFQINGVVDYQTWKAYTTDMSDTEPYKQLKDQSMALKDGDKVAGVPYVVESYGLIYNKDLLEGDMKNALYYGPVSSTGDGLLMATAIGADTRLLEYGKRYPNGIEVSEGIAKSTINGNIPAWKLSAILVNKEGKRVVNEKASNRTILETELQQTGQELYLVMDQATFDVWKDALGYDVSAYLEANGATTPVFGHGDTIAEAAEAAGVDAAALEATVETYNSYVEAGEDAEFGRGAEYLTVKIGEGPYYIVEQKPRFATTMGGLVIDEALEVVNTEGGVIPGLYAAGEVVGGVMGDDSPSGANNGWAVTSGRLAAESIAAALALEEAA